MQKEENTEQISLFIHDFSDGKMSLMCFNA